jgi:hypothetical protein
MCFAGESFLVSILPTFDHSADYTLSPPLDRSRRCRDHG